MDIRDLLGIDFDDMGLAETIDNVTQTVVEMHAVHDAIGRAIFEDGGLLEDETKRTGQYLKELAFDDERVMNMLCYYAKRSDEFMERLED